MYEWNKLQWFDTGNCLHLFSNIQKQLAKHLFLSLCNLGNLLWRFLTVEKLDTRLGWHLRVGFDIKEGVNYNDFTFCLCVCLNVCLCYQGLRFLCYVSCVMFPVLCVLLYVSWWINDMWLTYLYIAVRLWGCVAMELQCWTLSEQSWLVACVRCIDCDLYH